MESALIKLSRNEAARQDGTVIEILADLDELIIGKITYIQNEIYNSGEIKENLI